MMRAGDAVRLCHRKHRLVVAMRVLHQDFLLLVQRVEKGLHRLPAAVAKQRLGYLTDRCRGLVGQFGGVE